MMIDEVIDFCNEKSKNIKLKTEQQAFVMITEMLEKLKAIENGFTDDLLNMGYTKGYRRGIDDLIFKINEHKTKGYVTGITHNPFEFGACQMADDIVKIAEQLKEGGENENIFKS